MIDSPESSDVPEPRNSRKLLRQITYLPMYDDMSDKAIQKLCEIIKKEEGLDKFK